MGNKVTLTSTTPEFQTKKTVQVEPEETQRSVSYQAPTPEMQEYIQKNIIKPTQRAYGINPNTGDVTPFQALGYNPEDERKRREAEMALNDRKRKENAWYNAFAVVGDSLTAALGGNVWQRQPNRIGAQANADNQRLIAEQKAEDMNNAAMLRNAGVKYADAVNRLIQNYLTKTTTTNKTGGSRTETTDHPQVVSTREAIDYSGKRGNGGANKTKYVNIDITESDGSMSRRRYDVTEQQYKALQGILKEHYNKILNGTDEKAQDLYKRLMDSHVILGFDKNKGQYIYDNDQLLLNGRFWMLDDPTRRRIEKEVPGIKFKNKDQNESVAPATSGRIDPQTGKPKNQTTYYSNYGTR